MARRMQNGSIKVRIQKFFGTYVAYNCEYLPHTIIRFFIIDFQLNVMRSSKMSLKLKNMIVCLFVCLFSFSIILLGIVRALIR